MSSFANLKRESGNLDKLSKALESLKSSDSSDKSDNYWKPEVDKSGNGMATIRFLPSPPADGDDGLPWVKFFSHGFQGTGGWLIDECLTTLNQSCPICESNSVLWNSGIEANKDVVRKRKRKLNYVANVYIVSDPKHPENEGQVKLFKFGAKIFDKITEAMNPEFDDEEAINPFDLWKGANFKMKIRKVEGYQNYDRSEFESPGPLFEDDSKLEKIWNSEFSLKALVDPSQFKTYDQLKNRLDKVLGNAPSAPSSTVTASPMQSLSEKVKSEPRPFVEVEPDITEEDDDMKYFEKLAQED